MQIVLIGFGKMGQQIATLAEEQGHQIAAVIQRNTPADERHKLLQSGEVAIEFTAPEQAADNLIACANAGIPVVCGTTGWLGNWNIVTEAITRAQTAMVYASNFSIGVNLFFALNQHLAGLMKDKPYKVSIEETHHIHKKDAPSGTAITLAEQILKKHEHKARWVQQPPVQEEELLILSHREDEVPGTHIVRYASDIDTLEIKHEAHNRKGFAAGALLAAEWVAGKQGIYSMQDVLQL